MSNIDRETDFRSLTTVLRLVLDEFRRTLLTSVPGIVEEFDPETRRARVQPALQMRLSSGKLLSQAPLLDVPVIFPSGGGYTMLFQLVPGDPVQVFFTHRGLSEFKQSLAESPPSPGRIISATDAVLIPGWGGRAGELALSPAVEEGVSLQREDGTASIRLTADRITLDVPSDQKVYIGGEAAAQELATKQFVQNLYNTHVHATPAGPSGPPVTAAPLTPGADITKETLAE